MKKNDKRNENAVVVSARVTNMQNDYGKSALQVAKATGNKIKEGLAKPTASTGTPMNDLHGGAAVMAAISNIGNGSVANGGGGVKEGLETITIHAAAKGILAAESKHNTTKKIKDATEKRQ